MNLNGCATAFGLYESIFHFQKYERKVYWKEIMEKCSRRRFPIGNREECFMMGTKEAYEYWTSSAF